MKAEACVVCGTPRHGMLPKDFEPGVDVGTDAEEEEQKARRSRL